MGMAIPLGLSALSSSMGMAGCFLHCSTNSFVLGIQMSLQAGIPLRGEENVLDLFGASDQPQFAAAA